MTPVRYAAEPGPDMAAFHNALFSNSTDPLTALVYADWLGDRGMPFAAQVIRDHANLTPSLHKTGHALISALASDYAGQPGSFRFHAQATDSSRGEFVPGLRQKMIGKPRVWSWVGRKMGRDEMAGLVERLRSEGVEMTESTDRDFPPRPEQYARPARYAWRFAVKVHPSLRGYHVAHKLRDLAVDPDETVANLAREALKNGPHVLPVLADELEAKGHPAAGHYNWRAIPRGIQIDNALTAAAEVTSRHHNAYLDREFGDDHGIPYRTPARDVDTARMTTKEMLPYSSAVEGGPEYIAEATRLRNRLERMVRTAVPDVTPGEFEESLWRVHGNYYGREQGDVYSMPRRQRSNRNIARHPRTSLTESASQRFHGTQAKFSRPRRYASFPGAAQPTVTVRVPVPTQVQPRPKPQAQPAPQPAPVPVAPQQDPNEPEFRRAAVTVPRSLIFPHGGGQVRSNVLTGGARRMARPVKMAREDLHAFIDAWAQNPHDPVHAGVLADYLIDQGHHAAPFILQKSMENPQADRGVGSQRFNGNREIGVYHAMIPPRGDTPPVLVAVAKARPETGHHAIAAVGISKDDWPTDVSRTTGRTFHMPPIGTMTKRYANLTVEEARYLADLIRADDFQSYLLGDIDRGRRVDPHRWLDLAGVARPRVRRRHRFSRT